jgi:hypothetical protein
MRKTKKKTRISTNVEWLNVDLFSIVDTFKLKEFFKINFDDMINILNVNINNKEKNIESILQIIKLLTTCMKLTNIQSSNKVNNQFSNLIDNFLLTLQTIDKNEGDTIEIQSFILLCYDCINILSSKTKDTLAETFNYFNIIPTKTILQRNIKASNLFLPQLLSKLSDHNWLSNDAIDNDNYINPNLKSKEAVIISLLFELLSTPSVETNEINLITTIISESINMSSFVCIVMWKELIQIINRNSSSIYKKLLIEMIRYSLLIYPSLLNNTSENIKKLCQGEVKKLEKVRKKCSNKRLLSDDDDDDDDIINNNYSNNIDNDNDDDNINKRMNTGKEMEDERLLNHEHVDKEIFHGRNEIFNNEENYIEVVEQQEENINNLVLPLVVLCFGEKDSTIRTLAIETLIDIGIAFSSIPSTNIDSASSTSKSNSSLAIKIPCSFWIKCISILSYSIQDDSLGKGAKYKLLSILIKLFDFNPFDRIFPITATNTQALLVIEFEIKSFQNTINIENNNEIDKLNNEYIFIKILQTKLLPNIINIIQNGCKIGISRRTLSAISKIFSSCCIGSMVITHIITSIYYIFIFLKYYNIFVYI